MTKRTILKRKKQTSYIAAYLTLKDAGLTTKQAINETNQLFSESVDNGKT